MKKNLDLFERVVRAWVSAIALLIGLVIVRHPVARLLFIAFGGWAALEAVTGSCPLYRHLGVRKPGEKMPGADRSLLMLLGVQLSLSYVWWHAGYEKLAGDFVSKLPETLGFFLSKNPYPFMHAFLARAVPKALQIGVLVEWGQVATALALAGAVFLVVYGSAEAKRLGYALSIVALFAGAIMNAAFYLAAGWTGPATATSNIAMLWPELLLLYYWKVRYLEVRK